MLRRNLLRAAIGVLLASAAFAPMVTARQNTQAICHIDETNGGYDVIWVKPSAVAGHIKHGDSTSYTPGPDGTCTPIF